MFKTILVALDASQQADIVVQTLDAIELQAATKVILAHVIPPSEVGGEWAADRPHNPAEEIPYIHLEKQLQAYQVNLPCASQIEIVSGDPAAEIVRLANIHAADLIVIGSRGLTGLNRILQGSVSGQVVEEAPCSVLVVKQK